MAPNAQYGAGADPYMIWLAQQIQNGQAPQPTNVASPQQAPQQQQQPVSQGQQYANMAGQWAGNAAGGYLANQAIGGAQSWLSGSSGAAPATPNIVGASNLGSSSAAGAPSAPNLVSATSGVPSTPSLVGAGPWWEASVGSDAAALGSNIGSGLQSAGMGAESASAAGSALGTAIPAAAGIYGAYQLGQNLSDRRKDWKGGASAGAATGAAIGSFIPGIGTLIGGAIGGVVGGAAGALTGNSHNYFDAEKRMKGVQHLIDIGFLQPIQSASGEPAGVLDLPDGNTYVIGGDEHQTTTGIGGKELHGYDVDFDQEGVGGIVAAVNPLAGLLAGGNDKLTKDIAGYLTRAATASGDPMKNIMAMYQKLGLGHDQIYGAIHMMSEEGKLDKEKADAYKNGLDELYGVGAYEGRGPRFGDPNTPTTATPRPSQTAQPQPMAPQQGSPRPTWQPGMPRDPHGTTNQQPRGNVTGAAPTDIKPGPRDIHGTKPPPATRITAQKPVEQKPRGPWVANGGGRGIVPALRPSGGVMAAPRGLLVRGR